MMLQEVFDFLALQEVIDAWEEDFSEGVENLGWELDDNEVYFHGKLTLERVESI